MWQAALATACCADAAGARETGVPTPKTALLCPSGRAALAAVEDWLPPVVTLVVVRVVVAIFGVPVR